MAMEETGRSRARVFIANALRAVRNSVPLWILIWPAIAILLGMLGWGTLLSSLAAERSQIERMALNEAADLSTHYAERVGQILEGLDQVLLFARFNWQHSHGQLPLEQARRAGLFPTDRVFFLGIFDREGTLQTSTLPLNPETMQRGAAALQQNFLEAKHGTGDTLYIGNALVTGPVSGRQIWEFSRKILGDDGTFEGVVTLSVLPDRFVNYYTDAVMGQHGLLGIAGTERSMRLTRIGHAMQETGRTTVLLPPLPSATGSMVLAGEHFIDQRSRFIGWQEISGYPLIALAGLDQQEILAPFWGRRATAIRTAIRETAALAFFTMVAMALSMLVAWKKRRLGSLEAAYRVATEGGSDGFYIARPVRDKNGTVLDFVIVDCNERGAAFYRQSRRQLIGARISSLYSGVSQEQALSRLYHTLRVGYYDRETELPDTDPRGALWMHFRMVETNGDVAVTVRDITDAKKHLVELERRSQEDLLTGLPNWHWLHRYLPQAIEQRAAADGKLAVVFIDLDGFKEINDALGHTVGDELLRYVAERLKTAVRPYDHVVRFGGDEFVVVVDNVKRKDDIIPVAERILHAFRDPFPLSKGPRSIGASIGISVFPEDGATAEVLLQSADMAMYAAKGSGKGRFRFYETRFFEALQTRLEKENELRQALQQDQFVVHYQPRVDLRSGELASMEALVRWAHPTRGLIGPNQFVLMAEETGMIVELGRQVIEKVCAQLREWRSAGLQAVPVSVNVSPRQFHETDLKAAVDAALARHEIMPALLEMEVTESIMVGNDPKILETLKALQQNSIKICIDDFGTGYSSLAQLLRFRFDILKVDRAFVLEIDRAEQGAAFVNAIITLAHTLGMQVVAEGAENARQVEVLKTLQCDEVQGFYIARPLPPGEMASVLANGSAARSDVTLRRHAS